MEMPKGVHMMELTPNKVAELWDKLHVIDGLFDDYTRGNYQLFTQRLQSKDSVYLERDDGNGILYLSAVKPGLSAFGHVVYWDKRLRGREDFTLSCLQWLMHMLSLRKMNVWLPSYAKAAIAFAKRMGFKQEGTIRSWSYSNGKLFDIEAFGMTNEEVYNERFHESTAGDVQRTTSGSSEQLVPEHGDTTDGESPSTDDEPQHDGDEQSGDTEHSTFAASSVSDGAVDK